MILIILYTEFEKGHGLVTQISELNISCCRLKRDLKRTKALLRDAQAQLERSKGDSSSKAALRQLKNQLEDAEYARAGAVKAKQAIENELSETQVALDEALRSRNEAEDRANSANRERTELVSQLEENEEELSEARTITLTFRRTKVSSFLWVDITSIVHQENYCVCRHKMVVQSDFNQIERS